MVLYMKFRKAWEFGPRSTGGTSLRAAQSERRRPFSPRPPAVGEWPRWAEPDETAVLRLAQVAAPYVRMLHPDIVRAVVQDRISASFRATLWSNSVVRYVPPRLALRITRSRQRGMRWVTTLEQYLGLSCQAGRRRRRSRHRRTDRRRRAG